MMMGSIPPVISKGYEAKGEYKTIGGLKTCMFWIISSVNSASRLLTIVFTDVTGPADATRAILVIYGKYFFLVRSISKSTER